VRLEWIKLLTIGGADASNTDWWWLISKCDSV